MIKKKILQVVDDVFGNPQTNRRHGTVLLQSTLQLTDRHMIVSLFFQRVEQKRHVFFFQAEDGIRDYKVTGVQTCALPISPFVVQVRAAWGEPGEDDAVR